ncbi:MAG: flagellar export protein FliJ [Candidatus Gastranaerophilales bacterium]|nr:flagellar export protein FliJ [Candidatus Gastranaerophilales bacterium]
MYNLQKVLNFRITKRDEQIEVVKRAEQKVAQIQAQIDEKKQEVYSVQENMRHAQHIMMETYDRYIKHLHELIAKLEEDKQKAIKILEQERETLTEYEQGVKVLEKHKEKKKEEYLAEEKRIEMKRLDEVGAIKHFRLTREKEEEELELEELLKLREYDDEY